METRSSDMPVRWRLKPGPGAVLGFECGGHQPRFELEPGASHVLSCCACCAACARHGAFGERRARLQDSSTHAVSHILAHMQGMCSRKTKTS